MPIDNKELRKALAVLTKDRNVRVTLQQAGKGTAICAVSCFVGGVLFGPRGLALGGLVGGLAASTATEGCFRPLSEVLINDITDKQMELLKMHIYTAVEKFHPMDLAMLLYFLKTNNDVKETVFNIVLKFVKKEMHLQVVN